MNRDQALQILREMTQGEALLKHARSVELVMRAAAKARGEDEDLWGLVGLLHDADYERYPEEHPLVIVRRLEEMGETKIAKAISGHYTKWNVPYESTLDKAIVACDELTGFVTACCLVRPNGISDLEAKSVLKKLKDKGFAAKVEREEIQKGVDLLGVPLAEHVAFVISVLREHRAELGLPG